MRRQLFFCVFLCLLDIMIGGCAFHGEQVRLADSRNGAESQKETDGSTLASQDKMIARLIQQLGDADVGVRINAADELGQMREGAKESYPCVDTNTQRCALGGSSKCSDGVGEAKRRGGESAQTAVPALEKALQDENASVRSGTAWALGRIGKPAQAAVPALEKALRDESQATRFNAAYALGRMGEAAQNAVPALIQALSDTDEQVRRFAAEALKRIGTSEAIKAVEEYQKKETR